MKKSDYILKSFMNASGVFLYIFAVAWVMFNSKGIFEESIGIFIPVFMLLLFIISATTTGFLVLGKPIHLYMSNSKREAFILLFSTLAWLAVFLIVVVIAILSV